MNKIGQIVMAIVVLLSTILPFNLPAQAAEITVAEAIANNSGTATVEGYIVGYTLAKNSYTTDPARFGTTNLAIADAAGETDPAKVIPVQLTSDFRSGINLLENPQNLGKKIRITGTLEPYFTTPGLKNPSSVTLLDDETATPEQPIEEPVEKQPIAEIRLHAEGTAVSTSGIVTAVFGNTVYIQDETAGIVLYNMSTSLNIGDVVDVTGKLDDYNTLLEIVLPGSVTVTGTAEVPQSKQVQASELNESLEGMLVTINEVTTFGFSGGNYTARDAAGTTFQIRPQDAALMETNINYDSVTGVLGSYRDVYQLIPRSASDIAADSSAVQPVNADPAPGFIEAGTPVALSTQTESATIYYTLDGSEPTSKSALYTEPLAINKNTVIKAKAVKNGLTNSKTAEFSYVIQTDTVRIHDIQGEGHTSPYKDLNVEQVQGIVTRVADNNNVYMQSLEPDENNNTSEGILVYKRGHGLLAGDVISVSGTVKEWVLEGYSEKLQTDLPVTEINASAIKKTSSNQPLPEPVVLTEKTMPREIIDNDQFTVFDPEQDGIDFFESIEGMLIQVNNPKVVAPQRYGEVVVVPGNMSTNTESGALRITGDDFNPERIHLDLNDENFVAKTGDYFNGPVTGVVSYGYSNYKVLVNKKPELAEGPAEPEQTTLTSTEKKLTIASYNLENFSAASSADKTSRLARGIAVGLQSPDIIAVTEVQDNDGPADLGTTDASESAAALIAAIKALGGPAYEYTDVAPENKEDGGQPGGNIRVGFLFNPDRVELAEAPKGTATEATGYENGKLTLNPGRIAPENEAFADSRKPLAAQFIFGGESVIVVANHFNSKGGDEPLFGQNQPPALQSEEQRKQMAAIVNGFVQDVQAENPNANVVLAGDFNDFEFTEALQILKGEQLANMIEKVPADERYTYSYQGNAQVLDHILVTNNLVEATEVDIVHTNSQFMEEHGRASDHDPVIIRTVLGGKTSESNATVVMPGNRKQYTVAKPNLHLQFDEAVRFEKGIVVKHSAVLDGKGLKSNTVIVSVAQPGQVIDFNGAEVQEVQIKTKHSDSVEFINDENVQKWTDEQGEKLDPAA